MYQTRAIKHTKLSLKTDDELNACIDSILPKPNNSGQLITNTQCDKNDDWYFDLEVDKNVKNLIAENVSKKQQLKQQANSLRENAYSNRLNVYNINGTLQTTMHESRKSQKAENIEKQLNNFQQVSTKIANVTKEPVELIKQNITKILDEIAKCPDNECYLESLSHPLTWNDIQNYGSKSQKTKFVRLREKLKNNLQKRFEKLNKSIRWIDTGSKSISSDLDITLVPKLHEQQPDNTFIDYYNKVMEFYNTKFKDMNELFNMNIYASPFIYIYLANTYLINNVNFVNDIDLSPILPNSPKLTRQPSIWPNSPRTPKRQLPNSKQPSISTTTSSKHLIPTQPDKIYFLNSSDENIKKSQYEYLSYFIENENLLKLINQTYKSEYDWQNDITGKNNLKELEEYNNISKLTINDEKRKLLNNITYKSLIRQYVELVFLPTDKIVNKEENTSKALDILSKSTFFLDEAYHTQGSILHVVMQPEFKQDYFPVISPLYFVCSVYENLGYAEHFKDKYTDKDKGIIKASKYIERFAEALIIIILRLLNIDFKSNNLFYYSDSELYNHFKKDLMCYDLTDIDCTKLSKYNELYKAIFNLFIMSRALNIIRKNPDIDAASNKDKIITEFNKNKNYNDLSTFVYSIFNMFNNDDKTMLFNLTKFNLTEFNQIITLPKLFLNQPLFINREFIKEFNKSFVDKKSDNIAPGTPPLFKRLPSISCRRLPSSLTSANSFITYTSESPKCNNS
jgi:hypothetical protein